MIDTAHPLSVTRQAALVGISRAAVYYQAVAVSERDLALMRHIDELHLEQHKDMPVGMRAIAGIWYWYATDATTREIAMRLFGKLQQSTGSKDKPAARLWWGKTIAPALDNLHAEANAHGTVNALLLRYENEVLPTLKSAATRDYYTSLLPGLKNRLGKCTFARSEQDAVRGDHLRRIAVQRDIDEQRLAGRPTIGNREIRLLGRIFRIASTRWGLTEYNPAAGVEYNDEPAREVYADDSLYDKVRAAAPAMYGAMMDTSLASGARIGMIMAIMLGDIEGDLVRVLITPNKIKAGRKAVKRPYALRHDDGSLNDLGAAIAAALAARRDMRNSGNVIALPSQQPLFLNRNGEAWTKHGHKSAWRRACDKAGIDWHTFHFHDIRAKTASDSDSLQDAQERLGHTDSATTNRVYRRKIDTIQPLLRKTK